MNSTVSATGMEVTAKANNVDHKLTKEILKIEKEHVYQKSRHTRVSIKQLISDKSTEEEK